MLRGDVCGSQTPQQTENPESEPRLAPLPAHGTASSRVPKGPVCPTFTLMGLTQSCRNAGPLSPPKQVAGSASAEEGLRGGFSSPSSEVGLKGYHSNRWARPPLLCPSVKDRAAPGTWTGSRSTRSPPRHLRPRHSAGSQCVPEHVCAHVGRDMGHCALEARPRPGPRALTGAHALGMNAAGAPSELRVPPCLVAPAAAQALPATPPPPRAVCRPH